MHLYGLLYGRCCRWQ